MEPNLAAEERQASPWPRVIGVLAVLLAVAVALSLMWLRLSSNQPRPQGRALGSVTVAPGIDFTCSLPVTAYGQTAATISFPKGEVTVQSVAPAVTPGAKGVGPASYDTQLGRWLPVQRQWVSPDGRQYAYSTQTTGIPGQPPSGDVRVRDIASGKDRVLWQGAGGAQVMGWNGGTIVFTLQVFTASPTMEVWGVDAAGGAPRRLGPNPPPAPTPGQSTTFFGGGILAGGALWTLAMSQPMPTTPPAPGQPFFKGPDTVTRMDLRDGTTSRWFKAPAGSGVGIIGADLAGHPIVSVNQATMFTTPPPPGYLPPAPRVLLLNGPDASVEITTGSAQSARLVYGGADSHGVWFTAPGELWLYRGGAIAKVATIPNDLFPAPPPPPGVQVASKPVVLPTALQGPFVQVAGACT